MTMSLTYVDDGKCTSHAVGVLASMNAISHSMRRTDVMYEMHRHVTEGPPMSGRRCNRTL